MTSWDRSLRNIERASPRWPPGQVPAYQAIIFGFILGEVIQRVTGTPLPEPLADEFLRPLGLADTYLGLPRRFWDRHVPVQARGAGGWITRSQVNRRTTRRAVIPSAGISTTATDLARFYQALLNGGELDGVRILDPATVDEARRPAGPPDLDRVIKLHVRWAHGFQLGNPASSSVRPHPMGGLADLNSFGHNGSNCCLAWADPSRQLAFAYLTSVVPSSREGARHISAVSDAVISALS